NDVLIGGAGNDVLSAGDGTDSLSGGAGNDKMYGNAGTNNLYGGAGDDNYYGGTGVDTYQFNLSDGAATERVSFFQATDIIQLNGFGFANAGSSFASFSQAGANVIFSSGGVTIVFYGATLAFVQGAVQVDGLAELPSVDKNTVAEAPELPQDAIAEFLETADTVDDHMAQAESESFDFYTGAELLDGHGFDLL
ncbi:MAG TPA: hypothetical protein ENJ42_04425, partial [Hellea balneolensis]|nr:hypothetical protein [Hellea balneolensis]